MISPKKVEIYGDNQGNGLPDGWCWQQLGDHVLKVGSGITPRGGQTSYVAEGIPLIRSQNVHMNRFAYNGLAYITAKQDAVMDGSRVQPNDVLLNITGASIGRVCVVPDDLCPANVNQHVSIIRLDGALSPHFLAYYISSPNFQKFIADRQAGATRQALTKALIETFRIPAPPLAEQQRIAALLQDQTAAVERARVAGEVRLAAAIALRGAYLHEILDNPDAKDWPRRKLGEIACITASQVNPTLPEFRDLPHVNGENIEAATCHLTKVSTAAEDRMTSGKYLFEPGAVLYSKLRPYLRKAVLVDFRGLCSADMYPLTVDETVVDRRFILWSLVTDRFTEYAVGHSQRARMPKLNRDQLFAWQCPLPPLAEQRRLMDCLTSRMEISDKVVNKVEQEMRVIEALPAALLDQAFNGEL